MDIDLPSDIYKRMTSPNHGEGQHQLDRIFNAIKCFHAGIITQEELVNGIAARLTMGTPTSGGTEQIASILPSEILQKIADSLSEFCRDACSNIDRKWDDRADTEIAEEVARVKQVAIDIETIVRKRN
jgi:hypothetical protein